MITEQLQNKINKSYDVLKVAAKMSKTYYHKPLIITYSGGKDSDVILKLAMECLDEEDFEVINSHTTVDAPETVYYIRDKFKYLNDIGIKATVQYPHYKDGSPITMWNLIVKKQMPPTRIVRYCCNYLKETTTPNRFIATGVRMSESTKRRGRDAFGVLTPNRKGTFFSLERVKENLAESLKRGGDEVSAFDCKIIEEAKNNTDLICNPIYEWSTMDVWNFIRGRGMKYNPLYDEGFERVGCIGCPFAGNQIQELERYPKYKENYIRAFDRMMKARKTSKKRDRYGWTDGESVYRWWIQDDTVPGQMSIEDYLGKGADDEV